MKQQLMRPTESRGPAPGGGIFADSGSPGGTATVAAGLHHEQIPVANLTVGEIRRRYRDRFDIDPQSGAMIDGQEVDDDTILRDGQVLRFTHQAGRKGMATPAGAALAPGA